MCMYKVWFNFNQRLYNLEALSFTVIGKVTMGREMYELKIEYQVDTG